MIHLEQAQKITLKEARLTNIVQVTLSDAPGRVLAADIVSDLDMPPFDKSAVDGYACRLADLRKNLKVIETISAGVMPGKAIRPLECSKIMTGARMPEGADGVIMVEQTEEYDAGTIQFKGEETSKNICYRGEDLRAGDLVLKAGMVLRPQHIAVLASVGAANPPVYNRPRVAVLATGDELVDPSVKPEGAMIRDSNSHQLVAQIREAGANPVYSGIIPDSPRKIRSAIETALGTSDIVLLTGGVSMGDYDYVPGIMKEAGINIMFRTIAIQPGKPTLFGEKNGKLIFGLPGNPVSCFVLFEILVKPLIYAMTGRKEEHPLVPLPMGIQHTRKRAERMALIPVSVRSGEVFPVDYHGSAHIHAYVSADGIVSMEIGETELKKGAIVHVRPV